jgi:pyruvate kinase
MSRRTKIVATIGPASDSEKILGELMDAGMDVARLGLAHNTLDEVMERYRRIRKVAAEGNHTVGILVDLPGPKVRLASFGDHSVGLDNGASLRLVPGRTSSVADEAGVDYVDFLNDIRIGDTLSIGDGALTVQVKNVGGDAAEAVVTHGGMVQGRPGLHIPSDRLSMPTPTSEDLRLLDAFVDEGVDMVAISFVRSAHDIRRVGTEPHPRGPLLVAKIETRSAVENLEGIVAASGAVMVARGDLGTELGIEELPHLQKRITRECIAGGKPVITATQMFESMINSPTPTRAEVSDVANAIIDGSSAVMLSAETAVGINPVNTVATMARVASRADADFDFGSWATTISNLRSGALGSGDQRITDAMTAATWRAATEMGVSAIICISNSGFTVRSIARFRPSMPIIAFSPMERTVRQLTMSWGTVPVLAQGGVDSLAKMDGLIRAARDGGHVRTGDFVAVLAGAGDGSHQATDVLRLTRVP